MADALLNALSPTGDVWVRTGSRVLFEFGTVEVRRLANGSDLLARHPHS